jgi:hypothetical protein
MALVIAKAPIRITAALCAQFKIGTLIYFFFVIKLLYNAPIIHEIKEGIRIKALEL